MVSTAGGEISVFLAAPYSQFMDHDIGEVGSPWRQRIDALRRAFIREGCRVFNAHHNEAWGRGWLAADVCTPIDFAAVKACDVVCAILGEPASGGVLVELGWASALGKPCCLVGSQTARPTPMVEGLSEVTDVRWAEAPRDWSPVEVDAIVAKTLSAYGATPRESSPGAGSDSITFCMDGCSHDALAFSAP